MIFGLEFYIYMRNKSCKLHKFNHFCGIFGLNNNAFFRYHLIVHHHLKNKNYTHLLESCKRLGVAQPSLWLQALTGLRNDKNAPANLLAQILQVICMLFKISHNLLRFYISLFFNSIIKTYLYIIYSNIKSNVIYNPKQRKKNFNPHFRY